MNGSGRIPARATVSWGWFWVVYAVGPGLALSVYPVWLALPVLAPDGPSSAAAGMAAMWCTMALYGQFLSAGLSCLLVFLLAADDRRRPELLLLLPYWVGAGWFVLAGFREVLVHACALLAAAIPVVAFARRCGPRRRA